MPSSHATQPLMQTARIALATRLPARSAVAGAWVGELRHAPIPCPMSAPSPPRPSSARRLHPCLRPSLGCSRHRHRPRQPLDVRNCNHRLLSWLHLIAFCTCTRCNTAGVVNVQHCCKHCCTRRNTLHMPLHCPHHRLPCCRQRYHLVRQGRRGVLPAQHGAGHIHRSRQQVQHPGRRAVVASQRQRGACRGALVRAAQQPARPVPGHPARPHGRFQQCLDSG